MMTEVEKAVRGVPSLSATNFKTQRAMMLLAVYQTGANLDSMVRMTGLERGTIHDFVEYLRGNNVLVGGKLQPIYLENYFKEAPHLLKLFAPGAGNGLPEPVEPATAKPATEKPSPVSDGESWPLPENLKAMSIAELDALLAKHGEPKSYAKMSASGKRVFNRKTWKRSMELRDARRAGRGLKVEKAKPERYVGSFDRNPDKWEPGEGETFEGENETNSEKNETILEQYETNEPEIETIDAEPVTSLVKQEGISLSDVYAQLAKRKTQLDEDYFRIAEERAKLAKDLDAISRVSNIFQELNLV